MQGGLGIAILTTPKGVMTGRQARREGAVGAMVEKPAGLLPAQHVDPEADAVFLDFHPARQFAAADPRVFLQALQLAQAGGVLQHDGAGREAFFQGGEDHRLQPLHAKGVGLQRQHVAEAIHHQARQAVAFAVD